MADKKLSSVSAVSDMNYVYAETASGETVKISKADLASVVAALFNKEDIFPFTDRKAWDGSLNNRSEKKSGVYTVVTNQPTTGFPDDLELEYGILLYFKATGGSGGNPESQILVRTYPTDAVWVRSFWGGSSRGWNKIY